GAEPASEQRRDLQPGDRHDGGEADRERGRADRPAIQCRHHHPTDDLADDERRAHTQAAVDRGTDDGDDEDCRLLPYPSAQDRQPAREYPGTGGGRPRRAYQDPHLPDIAADATPAPAFGPYRSHPLDGNGAPARSGVVIRFKTVREEIDLMTDS